MATSLDITKLTPDDKLRLMAQLWDSLNDSEVALSPEQLAEIRRRLAATDANPDSLVSYAEMRRRLGWRD
jgi:putative addiction module component (TIGR02574 family)